VHNDRTRDKREAAQKQCLKWYQYRATDAAPCRAWARKRIPILLKTDRSTAVFHSKWDWEAQFSMKTKALCALNETSRILSSMRISNGDCLSLFLSLSLQTYSLVVVLSYRNKVGNIQHFLLAIFHSAAEQSKPLSSLRSITYSVLTSASRKLFQIYP